MNAFAFSSLIVSLLGSTASFNLKTPAPTDLAYSTQGIVATLGRAIPPMKPSSEGGAITKYSLSPLPNGKPANLPAGLSLDSKTGIIAGTPTAVNLSTNYTVLAANAGGTTSGTVAIAVKGLKRRSPSADH